jgi:mRNA-degrading endonuclease RelE of RelBE toxin-antitoxin system
VDKISKALKKLTPHERERVQDIIEKLEHGEVYGLEIKKLEGRSDIFRARKGNIRLIFQKKKGAVSILTIERRSENTYRKF